MAKLTRQCYCCKQTLDLDGFPKHSSKPLGKAYICKKCAVIKQQELYSKEQIKHFNRRNNLKKKYGMTIEEFNNLYESQNRMCLICKKETELVVDHCHSTGRVRGLLCRKCNTGLGMFEENILILNSAKEYLEYV